MKGTRRQFIQSASMTTAGFLGLQRHLRLHASEKEIRKAPTVTQPYQSEETKYGDLLADPKRLLEVFWDLPANHHTSFPRFGKVE